MTPREQALNDATVAAARLAAAVRALNDRVHLATRDVQAGGPWATAAERRAATALDVVVVDLDSAVSGLRGTAARTALAADPGPETAPPGVYIPPGGEGAGDPRD